MKYSSNDFYCTQCGNRNFPIWRKRGTEREPGHLKKLFCLKCGTETNHVEVKEFAQNYTYSDFVNEFEYGNFDVNGKRVRTIGQLKELINNGKIEKQKTLDHVRDPWSRQEYLDSES